MCSSRTPTSGSARDNNVAGAFQKVLFSPFSKVLKKSIPQIVIIKMFIISYYIVDNEDNLSLILVNRVIIVAANRLGPILLIYSILF